MAEEAEPLRESGEGVTAAGPAAGLQSPATVRGKPRRERESVTTGARPVSHEPRHGNTKICKEKRQK